MKNEPVAKVTQYGIYLEYPHGMNLKIGTKLYSNPIKDLTDEEIHELANEHLRTKDQDGAKVVLGLEDFARAILRKAQEK